MAEKVLLVDDLDGTETGVKRMHFGIDGEHFEVDLSEKNATELRAAVAKFRKVARPLPKRAGEKPKNSTPASSAARTATGPSAKEIRAWAKRKRIKVSPVGTIPNDVRERYLKENAR